MLNRRSFWGAHLSISTALLLGTMMPQFPTWAQLPTLTQTGDVSPTYRLGPGDEIQLKVFDYEEFTGTQLVLPDGTITVPLIGKVVAATRTLSDLTQDLTRRLTPWLKNPVVTVSITKFRPLLVNVAGEVQRPGPIQLNSYSSATLNPITSTIVNPNALSFVQLPTVSVAIVAAGGLTRNADIRRVLLKRFSPTGQSSSITLNLWDSLFSENAPRELVLQDGDAIFIPKLEPGDPLDQRLVARSSFAPRTVRVRVVGEVKRPGEVEVTPNSSLSSAVAIAGGPTDKAKLKNVRFVRLNDNGAIDDQAVDLTDLSDTYQVQEGDVIIVPKTNTYTALDFAAQLLGPLNFFVNFFDLFNN